MARQKRQSVNRVAGAVAMAAEATTTLQPPIELTPDETYYFNLTVRSMELAAWSPHRLMLAARIAQQSVQLDFVKASLAQPGGMVAVTDRGTPIPSPFISTQNTLTNSICSMTKTLGLSASAQAVSGSKQEGRNQASVAARNVLGGIGDELLAGYDVSSLI